MQPTRVLFVSYSFPPSANVGVFRALRFVRCLPEFGWEAVVLASEPEAKARVDASLAAKIPSGTIVRRVPINRTEDLIKARISFVLGLLRARKSHSSTNTSQSLPSQVSTATPTESEDGSVNLKTILKEIFFAIPDDRIAWRRPAVRAGMELVHAHRPEVVLVTAPPFSTMIVAAEIARKADLPLVLDFRDPWTRVPWGPRNKSRFGQKRATQLERLCVAQAARVILNTDALKSDFLRHYPEMDANKFCCIPNGYDNDLLEQVASMSPRENRPSRFTILHPGSLYRRRDPTPILHALASLKSSGNEVSFQQLGHCDPVFGLDTLSKQLGLGANLEVCKAIPHQQMLQRMLEVDAFCLVQPDTDLQVPGKLFEMILFRKPILALTGNGALADIIRKFQLGAVADPANAKEIARAIVSLQSRDSSAPRWDEALREFDGRKLTEKLSSVLAEAVRN